MPIKAYQRDLFCGRSDEIRALVDTLMDPNAHQKRIRAQMVEGGAQGGKTWLLRRVGDDLGQYPAVILFITSDFIESDWVPPTSPTPEQIMSQLLCDLWLEGIERLPSLTPPSVGPSDTLDERRQKIEQFVQEEPVNLLRDFIDHLRAADTPHVLVLIVDGIDEFEEPILHVLEDHFIVPLFAYPCVRLLSSRRVRSSTHRWVRFMIKQQLPPEPLTLKPFDAPDVQVDKLLSGTSYTFAYIRRLTEHYSWQNPGANDFLVERFKANHGTLTKNDFLDCLKELMQSVRTGGTVVDDAYFGYLGRLVGSPLDLSAPTGVARYEIKSVLGEVADNEINAFLAHLQERGIGYPLSAATFRIHTHIVELFKESK